MTLRTTDRTRLACLAVAVLLLAAGCASGPVRGSRTPGPSPSADATAQASSTPRPEATPSSTVTSTPTLPTPPPPTQVAATPTPPPATTPQPPPTPPPATTLPTGAAPTAASTVGRPSAPGLVEGQPAPEVVDLVRADGSPFRLADLAGHPAIVFFGYTHCPDVCPETIGTLLEVARAQPEVRIVFVTVDPERDTPAFLADWLKYLPEGIIGVTGTPAAIRGAADDYGVQYARVDTGSAAGYAMSHTASQYLIDGEGVLVRTYPFATPSETIIRDVEALQ